MNVAITVNFALLEDLFIKNNIVIIDEFADKITGHLGGEVKIDIPSNHPLQ